MSTAQKLSISLNRADAEWARSTAKRRRTSVSAIIAEALEKERRAEAQRRLLGLLGGDPVEPSDVAALEAEISGRAKRARRNA